MASERAKTQSERAVSPIDEVTGADTTPTANIQSDNASSDDHVRDKKANPDLSKRQKLKQHFGRFKWWYLLGLVILLAILLPLL